MSFATYTDLEDAVNRWMDRTDRGAEIQDWVALTEFEVGRTLNLRSQQAEVSGTLTGGLEFIETPAGILNPEMLVFNVEPIVVVTIAAIPQGEEFANGNTGLAAPQRASIWGINPSTNATKIRVWPPVPADVNYTLYYNTSITPLTSLAPTNYLLLVAPDLYLFGCRFHSDMFDENPQGALTWRQLLNSAISGVKKTEAQARSKGGRLRVRSQYATP